MRFARLNRDELSERQRETYDRIAGGPRQEVRGPFVAWLRSPVFADHAAAMGSYLRFESDLPGRIKELAVLMVAKSWHATFVWNAHQALALEAGLTEEAIDAIGRGHPPLLHDEASRIGHGFLAELLDDKYVSDETWRKAVDQFGDQGVVDLLAIAGYYVMVAMTVMATNLGGSDLPNPFRED
jgi:4-carboxymuconolactone decarboxylase